MKESFGIQNTKGLPGITTETEFHGNPGFASFCIWCHEPGAHESPALREFFLSVPLDANNEIARYKNGRLRGRGASATGIGLFVPHNDQVTWEHGQPTRSAGIFLRPEYLSAFAEEHEVSFDPQAIGDMWNVSSPELIRLADLLRLGADRNLGIERYRESISNLICISLIQQQRPGSFDRDAAPTAIPAQRLADIRDFIDANVGTQLTLMDLAQLTGLSRFHISRHFAASFGCSFKRYVMQRRVEIAKARLAHSDEPIISIAHTLGFASQSHFTTVFKDLVGTSPGLYRQERRPRTF